MSRNILRNLWCMWKRTEYVRRWFRQAIRGRGWESLWGAPTMELRVKMWADKHVATDFMATVGLFPWRLELWSIATTRDRFKCKKFRLLQCIGGRFLNRTVYQALLALQIRYFGDFYGHLLNRSGWARGLRYITAKTRKFQNSRTPRCD